MSNQVEDYNEPNLMSLQDFDDGVDLSLYDFERDHLTVPVDAANKRKLAYRHRYIADLYSNVKKKGKKKKKTFYGQTL